MLILTIAFQITSPDTVYAARDTQTRLASETADNVAWERYSSSSIQELASALTTITFSSEVTTLPLHSALECATKTIGQHAGARPIVVLGRSRRMAVESHVVELGRLVGESGSTLNLETVKTMGDVGSAFAATNVNASLLIVQASSSS